MTLEIGTMESRMILLYLYKSEWISGRYEIKVAVNNKISNQQGSRQDDGNEHQEAPADPTKN